MGPLGHLTELQQGESRRSTSGSPVRSSNRDRVKIQPGETHVLADIEGNGSIRHIWLTFPAPDSSWLCPDGCTNHSQLVIRMYWDGGELPAVEAPIGDFFALGFGIRADVNSLPVFVEGANSYNCYWIMPFRKSARIEVENQGDKESGSFYYQINYQIGEKNSTNTPYFCAQYRQKFPTESGKDYLILDAKGRGHYVGTVLSVRQRSPHWFGEGDETFFIDGDTRPTIKGTGTEDYVCQAWAFSKATTYPYFGVPILEGAYRNVGGIMTFYRWHIAEPISFNKSLQMRIENAGWISLDELAEGEPEGFVERNDDYSSVAFWYQVGQPHRFTELPNAKDRELPNLDIITEGTDLLNNARFSALVTPGVTKGYQWTGEGHARLKDVKPDNLSKKESWLEFDFFVEQEEYRQVTLRMGRDYDLGRYRIFLNGESVQNRIRDKNRRWIYLDYFDFYNPYEAVKEVVLGQFTLPVGKHTIRFECIGKNPFSEGYDLAFDSVRLRERWNIKRKRPEDLY